MKSKVFIFVLLLAALLFLAACQSSGESTSTEAEEANSEKSAGTETETEDNEVTLNLWFPGTGHIETAVQDIVTKFEEENPNIKVEVEAIPWADYFQKLSVGYAGGTAPDIHGIGFGQLIYTVMEDQYMDLNQFIEEDNWDGKDDMFESILEAGQFEGGQYGLLFPEVRPMVWRKDFFEEVGLDPEQPPQSIDEIFEFANKLKVIDEEGDTTRAGINISTQQGEQNFFSLLMLLGQDLYEPNGNPLWDNPDAIELQERLVDLYNDGAIIPSHSQQLEGNPFSNSQAAMSFESSPGIQELSDAVGIENIGWTVPPAGPDGDRTALMLGTFLTMSKNTDHPDEAWELIKFWFEPEIILEFTKQTGFAAPRKSLEEEFKALAPQNEVVFQTMEDARGYQPTEHWSVNMEYLRLALEESYNGIRPVKEAFEVNAEMIRQEIGLE